MHGMSISVLVITNLHVNAKNKKQKKYKNNCIHQI